MFQQYEEQYEVIESKAENPPVVTLGDSGYHIKIYHDDSPESPREYDGLVEFLFYHPRYNLGDHKFASRGYAVDAIKDALSDNPAVVVNVKLFDHSGLTLYQAGTGVDIQRPDYICDTSSVGVALVSKERAREVFNWKRISAKRRAFLFDQVLSSLEVYSKYINGESYCYAIEDPETGEELDFCGNLLGFDYAVEAAKQELEAILSK
jgi:hypothetical protein